MSFPSSALIAVAALATSIASCKTADEDNKVDSEGRIPLHPVSGEPALLTLRTTLGLVISSHPPGEQEAGFVAVWPDGTILWCPESDRDELRCLRSEIPPDRVLLAVDNLRKLMADPALTLRRFTIFDSAYDEVILFDGKQMSSVASCAHYWESHPTAVATDNGIVAVQDGDRDALVRSRSAEFNKLIDTWTRCVGEVRALVPAEGEPSSFPKEGWWDSKTGRCRVIEYPK